MKISVIVPTYNRSQDIRETLDCLLIQETKKEFDYEIIVVDNNSKDRTRETLEPYISKGQIKYFFELQQGKSFALNTGIKQATGDIIACVDDDCLFEKDYLWQIKQTFQSYGEDVGVLGGPIFPKWVGKDHPYWLNKLFEQPAKLENGKYNVLKRSLEGVLGILDLGDEPLILDYSQKDHPDIQFYGANMVFRKKCLDQFGTFDVHKKIEEDTEMCGRLLKAGIKGVYAPRAKMFHKIPTSKATPGFFYQWWFIRGGHMDLKDKDPRVLFPRVVDSLRRSFKEKDLFKRIMARRVAFLNLGFMAKLFRQKFA